MLVIAVPPPVPGTSPGMTRRVSPGMTRQAPPGRRETTGAVTYPPPQWPAAAAIAFAPVSISGCAKMKAASALSSLSRLSGFDEAQSI